ncbi:MAG: hypothetical protein H7Y61_08180, partial [Rhizobiales bacterium]|nr:hypothetical protein [Rhizobacter sp.]
MARAAVLRSLRFATMPGMTFDAAAPMPHAPVALTMGDACGIGPEIIAKLFRGPLGAGCLVIGDVAVMRRAAAFTGGMLAVAQVERVADALAVPPNCVPVLQVE